MPRYVALLRGVSPSNCKMPELKACFQAAGFDDVRTILSSGNVAFSAPEAALAALEQQAEDASTAIDYSQKQSGRNFGNRTLHSK